ncbi:putative bifunctional diguanylate cyclase/phosphodiesterase [Novosphingobium cyanobacteriorum]|uniref:Sensor domain-containing phosphodiesterase n=1 Tax=Novosphingobium cyanobacteriorum TaxID=3024215 RepID=A0ABT6CIV1_9SPHN|nr:sensor domain-containing phosphodiesterase [Novosphingobium cyanobacteriorum]MDF8333854.1 sensor domain-containing phosphodiesterase [Novosphingobium cyanobacteriorum]
MKYDPIPLPAEDLQRIEDLERMLERERKAREQAEAIAERGLRELYDSQVRLALLQRITDHANRSNNFAEVVDAALKEICGHMDWDFGNAYRIDRELDAAIACDTWYAIDSDQLFALIERSRHATFNRGNGLPGRVLRDAHPHWIDDFGTDTCYVHRAEAITCNMASACAFPILLGEELVGVIEFFSRKPMVDKDAILLTITQAVTQLARVVERERASAALLHDALHDAMTGLPNRVLLDERSRLAFERLPMGREGLAVMVIDLDGFKGINDKHGHHAGDMVLVEVASRFKSTITTFQRGETEGDGPITFAPWHATLARVGGDEFVVVLDALPDQTIVTDLAHRMIAALKPTIRIENEQVSVGASIGIAHSGSDYVDVEQIRRDADLAMYEAKSSGHGGVIVFSEALGCEARNRMALERELRDAIRDRQFVLHYQPIFSLDKSQRLRGFEALIRWNHPTRGMIDPGTFIPAAEESGLIVFIGDWVLRQGCTAMARLHERLANRYSREDLPFVSINIAPQQFLQPNFAAHVQRVLIETGVPPECLRLEVTEGVAIIDSERTRQVLEEIRAWGVRTSLDDFGTGYSSLSYLQNLPFDTLKIDRSFISSMDDPKSRKIIRAIMDLAGNLNLSVVAEGIETPEQGNALIEMGCEYGQGFHLGRPLDEASAFALIPFDEAA